MKTTLHKDKTVTYWSVMDQRWVKRAKQIPDEEYAAMSREERAKVMKHLKVTA